MSAGPAETRRNTGTGAQTPLAEGPKFEGPNLSPLARTKFRCHRMCSRESPFPIDGAAKPALLNPQGSVVLAWAYRRPKPARHQLQRLRWIGLLDDITGSLTRHRINKICQSGVLYPPQQMLWLSGYLYSFAPRSLSSSNILLHPSTRVGSVADGGQLLRPAAPLSNPVTLASLHHVPPNWSPVPVVPI